MKKSIFILLLISAPAFGSDTPLSGTYSNASKNSLNDTFNLVVTANELGQQFFIQCFKNGEVGFGTTTQFSKLKTIATINAGALCPASRITIELDYEEAYVRLNKKLISLPRREIYVPIVD